MNTLKGNVFDALRKPNSIVVHGCNAQGVMGSGVAEIVKRDYPEVFTAYRNRYDLNGLRVGQIIPVIVSPTCYIINAITQEFYGREKDRIYVSYSGLRECFASVRAFAESRGIATINYPMIGAGLAGGSWSRIRRIIDGQLSGLDHYVWVLK